MTMRETINAIEEFIIDWGGQLNQDSIGEPRLSNLEMPRQLCKYDVIGK